MIMLNTSLMFTVTTMRIMLDNCGWFLCLIAGNTKMDEKKNIAFNFGKNWQRFSENCVDNHKFEMALSSLDHLIGREKIKSSTFLDIGCGSGIFAIAASLVGAQKVIGIDISKESIAASINNKKEYASQSAVDFFHKSVFDDDISQLGKFDIVYSWGVLHHTGNMWKAIDIASKLVAPHTLFVIAIYNKHWSSGIWKVTKWFYNATPKFIQRPMIWTFYPIIATAKLIVTRNNPFKKRRGMSFYFDVIDWIGGYPYEYASREEIINHLEKTGFRCIKFVRPVVPTGCNEFVFLKT
jgi:2-polyprenyl-6-hydroxyphenyl methylase/3-demethylubiquinone-9 3-methyltransferase